MKSFPAVLYFLAALLGAGCSRTYISTGAPGIPSPDGGTRLCLTIHGAYGRAFTDKTRKVLDVWIRRGPYTNEVTLFSDRYRLTGGHLGTDVQWHSTNEVVMQVYDYGDGVLESEAQKRGIPSNHIATLLFQLDKQTGRFREKK